jgi:hypothetical protein
LKGGVFRHEFRSRRSYKAQRVVSLSIADQLSLLQLGWFSIGVDGYANEFVDIMDRRFFSSLLVSLKIMLVFFKI